MEKSIELIKPVDKENRILSEIPDSTNVLILKIAASRPAVRKLQQLSLFAGIQVKVIRQAPIGGPVLVEVAGREIAIGRKLATKIEVQVIS